MKKIDWLYFRKGWVSCKKAQKYFEQQEIIPESQTDARKQSYDADAVWQLLGSGERVVAARGKNIKDLKVSETSRDEILKIVMGPSGNLRAPTFKVGEYYVVGFNDEMYNKHLRWL